jgi:hypothetical protein
VVRIGQRDGFSPRSLSQQLVNGPQRSVPDLELVSAMENSRVRGIKYALLACNIVGYPNTPRQTESIV